MAKKRTMDELRQVKDSVYRKPPPKKMPRKSDLDRPARRPSKINRYKRERIQEQAKAIEKALLRGVLIGFLLGTITGIIFGITISYWMQ